MNWYKIAKEVSNEYSWTYVNLPSKIAKTMVKFGEEIDPDDLYVKEADGGLEKDSHITVKYAILTNEFKDVKELLKGEEGGKFYLGESSIFETDKYDVVKIDVESEDLKRLHEKLNNLPHEDKYPEYHAHATIAYLKSGRGKKYIGKFKINKSFSFDELFFGDQDKKDHKIKLAFNLSQYRYAQIWNVNIGDDGIEDKIAALYELEYKYSMVRDRFQGMPKRKENILRNLKGRLSDVLLGVKDILVKVFGEWLEKHALLSADTWAAGRIRDIDSDDFKIDESFRGMVHEYIRYAIYRGKSFYLTDKSAYDRYFNDMLKEVRKNISKFPSFYKVLGFSLRDYKENLTNDLVSMGFEKFGEEYYNQKFTTEEQAQNFIDGLTVEDADLDSLFYVEGIDYFAQAVENTGYDKEVLEEFYKNFVFPHWVEYWTAMGIEETRENIEKVYTQLQQINENNIENALVTINLAINTTHQTGDMLDYISEYSNGSMSSKQFKGFLDEMSAGSKSEEWNKELREVGVKI